MMEIESSSGAPTPPSTSGSPIGTVYPGTPRQQHRPPPHPLSHSYHQPLTKLLSSPDGLVAASSASSASAAAAAATPSPDSAFHSSCYSPPAQLSPVNSRHQLSGFSSPAATLSRNNSDASQHHLAGPWPSEGGMVAVQQLQQSQGGGGRHPSMYQQQQHQHQQLEQPLTSSMRRDSPPMMVEQQQQQQLGAASASAQQAQAAGISRQQLINRCVQAFIHACHCNPAQFWPKRFLDQGFFLPS